MNGKKVSQSTVEQIQILRYEHINGANRLFGGQLLEWIDVVAAVAARRHCECEVTTAAVDSLRFLGPAFANETLCMKGRLTHTGRTSMEVRVDSYVEALDGTVRLINTAYLVMVAVDENGRPVPVPALIPETEVEIAEWNEAERRRQLRRQIQA